MELIFLGTGSNNPSPHRGASSLALRLSGLSNVYLFDCGEGTQIQLQRSTLRASRITRIFLTHLHGDHLFGLPGLLCSLSCTTSPVPIVLYGPLGLREFVETTLRISHSYLSFKYEIVELIPNAYDGVDENLIPPLTTDEHCTRITLSDDGRYHLLSNEDNCSVYAVSIKHRVPTYGYIIVENDFPGKFDIQKLLQSGIKPGPFCSRLKAGESVTLDDGRVLSPSDYVGPSRPGRRLVILGDCSDASNIIPFAQQCDVLVHECTFEDTLRDKAIDFGHSTPSMAATLADRCEVKCLLLNHFSQRYRPRVNAGESIVNDDENVHKKQKKEGNIREQTETEVEGEEDVTVDLLLEQAKQHTSRPMDIDGTPPFTIHLPPPDRFEPSTVVAKLEPNQRQLNLLVIVLRVQGNPQVTREGHEIHSFKVADRTGSVTFNVWNTTGKLIACGDILRLQNCITQVFKNELCVKPGRNGTVTKVGEFLMDFKEEPDMSVFVAPPMVSTESAGNKDKRPTPPMS